MLFPLLKLVIVEGVKFLYHGDRDQLARNVCVGAVSINIVFAKVFQALLIKYSPNNLELVHNIAPVKQHWAPTIENVTLGKTLLGSGVVSVVYDAKCGTRDLVVKIKKKGVAAEIIKGLDFIKKMFSFLSWFPMFHTYDLLTLHAEIKAFLLDQLDFKKEVENQERFRAMFAFNPYYVVPVVVESSDDYIVMERLFPTEVKEKEHYATLFIQFVLKSTLLDGFLHADIHAGNLMFLQDGKLGVLDFGLVLQLTKEQQNDYVLLSLAMSKSDYTQAALVSIERYFYERSDKCDKRKAVEALENIYKKSDQKGKHFGTQEVLDMIVAVNPYGYNMTSPFYRILMSMAAADTFIHTLSPYSKEMFKKEMKAMCESF